MRTAPLAVTLALCAALLPACGGSGRSSSPNATADPPSHANASSHRLPDLQDASCDDWGHADATNRLVLLDELKASRAQPVTGRGFRGRGSFLADQQAQRMLDALCGRPHFQALRLYRLYALASDFAGGAP